MAADNVPRSEQYFAALPSEEIGNELFKRRDEYYSYIRKIGRLSLWRRSNEYFYQSIRTGGRVYYTGEVDEYTNVDIADYRNILMHLKVMTTSQRPAFETHAANTDAKSESQCVLAESLLDYYLREKRLERYANLAVEYALVYGDGWLELAWNPTAGNAYVATGEEGAEKILNEGDMEARAYTSTDVIFDYTVPNDYDQDWFLTRRFVNRYLLIAKYPDFKDEILNASISIDEKDTVFGMTLSEHTDLIPVYRFYHKRNEAMPDGRIVELVSPDAVLVDGPLPYKDIPLYRMSPQCQTGTPFGFTVGFDMLPLQEMLNALYSTVGTNQSNFGVQNITVPMGHNITVTTLTEGLNLIEYDPKLGKPEALNLTATPPEVFNFIAMIEKKMETISGVNSVARGNPEASLKSGAALALVQSTAIQFNSDLQRSYSQLMEDVGTGIINILKDFANNDRVATVVGKSNKHYVEEWSGKDLESINRVTVDLGNPLSRTTAGKVNMAEQLMNAGMIENPDQYIQVLTTGRIEPLLEGKRSELINIKAENEELAEGRMVPVVFTDHHAMHIIEHKAVIASPQARRDPKVIEVTTAHMQEHINQLRGTDPVMLALMGQQPPPPPAPSVPNTPGNGAAPSGAVPPRAEGTPVGDASKVKLPNNPSMPENPLTGNEWNPVTGGL